MAITARPGSADEFEAFAHVADAAFGEAARGADAVADLGRRLGDRFFVAFDDGAMVGTSADYGLSMSIPGGVLDVGHVTEVGVLPTHRRRGVLTALAAVQMDAAVQRGDPLLALTATEGAIYHRFGYGLATLEAAITLATSRSAFRDPRAALGQLRLVTLAEAAATLPAVYEMARLATPGGWGRSGPWWQRLLSAPAEGPGEGPLFVVVRDGAGGPDGYALYRYRYERDSAGVRHRMAVTEAIGTHGLAIREIWRFLCDIDLVAAVTARHQPVDHPLVHVVAEPRALGLTVSDGLWVRLLDVRAALERRSYAGADRLVLGLADEIRPDQAGTWLLDTGGDRATVSRVSELADLQLGASDLAATYLGETTFRQLADAGRVEERTAGAVGRADALFRTPVRPWSTIVP